MNEHVEVTAKDRKYFSSTRNYTLALLNSFNNIKYWVEQEDIDPNKQKEFIIPISFGSYEKSSALQDIDESTITGGNFNYLPRLVLGFEGMTKAPDRQTNKFQKLTKKVYDPDSLKVSLDVSYNSVAYDFHFSLLLQSRGFTINSQVVEEILVRFNPSLNLLIKEFPIFEASTETQILIGDPAFEILDEFAEEDVNIVQTTFDITVRGNIYSQIELKGAIETVKLFTHVWDEQNYKDSKLSKYYKFDVSENTREVYKSTERTFDGTIPNDEIVESTEDIVIAERPDYVPSQTIETFDEEYNTKN